MQSNLSFLYASSDSHAGNSSVNPSTKQSALWQTIQDYVQQERPYLDPLLMQRDLADRFGISTRTLCRLLSQFRSENFNVYINRYRIREVCRLMQDPELDHLNVELLAERAGFNSRGSFYRAFKIIMGESPAQYRQRIR